MGNSTKVAIVEKNASKVNYNEYFDFEFDILALCDKPVKRVLKKDITLDIEKIKKEYDYLILVGADACKHVAKISGVTKYQGYLVEGKYLPLVNPAMLAFKPEGGAAFNKAVEAIKNYVNGFDDLEPAESIWIQSEEEAEALFNYIKTNKLGIALDTETTALYPRKGYVLGWSVAYSRDKGYYIPSEYINETVEELAREIAATHHVVMHNAKFDIKQIEYHFNIPFKEENLDDTMLMHYALDEKVGTHGLKELAIKYAKLGDYDRALEEFKAEYCRKHKIKQSDFTYDLIPTDILAEYAALDAVATFRLYEFFEPLLKKNEILYNMYRNLLIKGSFFLNDVEENGVPFSKERLIEARGNLEETIKAAYKKLYEFEEVKNLEAEIGKKFNPNSVQQLRLLLFKYAKLPIPDKRTEKGEISTDAEVLSDLAKIHDLPKLILEYKKAVKIKSTYIDKALEHLDSDERLRTFFNLTTTTSGRLSSSGTLNMQQIPRDDKTVKYCIKARPGYVIISQDLATAEMYVVAVLSGDKNLQNVFKTGGDFHSTIAHMVFNLKCKVEEVKELYSDLRQAAKAISFGIKIRSSL